MSRRREPSDLEWASALRLAGYSLAAIAERTGIPPRTLSRHFSAASVTKGKGRRHLVQKALKTLLNDDQSNQAVQLAIAAQIQDDIALSRALRARLAEAIEALETSSHSLAIETCRALASVGTALRNSQFVTHNGMGKEALDSHRGSTELPQLIICEMTAEEVAEVRQKQRAALSSQDYGED